MSENSDVSSISPVSKVLSEEERSNLLYMVELEAKRIAEHVSWLSDMVKETLTNPYKRLVSYQTTGSSDTDNTMFTLKSVSEPTLAEKGQ